MAPSRGQPKPTIEDFLKELKLDLAKSKKELKLHHNGEETYRTSLPNLYDVTLEDRNLLLQRFGVPEGMES